MVAVYRDLDAARKDRTKFVWSVAEGKVKRDGTPALLYGKLIRHTEFVALRNVRCVVNAASVRRIQRLGPREVCAWCIGDETGADDIAPHGRIYHRLARLTIDPTKYDHFVLQYGQLELPVPAILPFVIFDTSGAHAAIGVNHAS